MRSINKPTINVRTVFTDCISSVRDAAFKTALQNSINTLENAEKEFDAKKQTNTLYLIAQNSEVNPIVNCAELKKIYTDKMLSKKNKGRAHYDNIMLSARNGICPLCGQRIVTTLDHYLPKSLYPLLSVTPLNLIPACSDCNKTKLQSFPRSSSEECLHPYYDNVEDFTWLKMTIIQSKPFVVEYCVNTPAFTPQLLSDRITYHFREYHLSMLYAMHAAEEFANVQGNLTELYNQSGNLELKEHLKDCYNSRFKNHKNSWQTAFYQELSNNNNFCNGGFI